VRRTLDRFLETTRRLGAGRGVRVGDGRKVGADELLEAMNSGVLEIDQFAEGYSERRLICVLYWIPGVPPCSFLTRASSLMAER
jgi:hypothetical protein